MLHGCFVFFLYSDVRKKEKVVMFENKIDRKGVFTLNKAYTIHIHAIIWSALFLYFYFYFYYRKRDISFTSA